MSNYKISLQPLGPYFFGGENTFGEDGTAYFVQSKYLPQQTALLGLLRYELLAQNNLLGRFDKKIWADLIGEASFQYPSDTIQNFGAIKKMSSLFLSCGTHHYLPQAADWAHDEHKQVHPLQISYHNDATARSYTNARKNLIQATVNEKPYDAKHRLKQLWVRADGRQLCQWEHEKDYEGDKNIENGFFAPHKQVGIHRKLDRTDRDRDDFYKQVFYRLRQPCCFTFFAEIDLPASCKLESRNLHFGGERSFFSMSVKKDSNENFNQIFTPATFTTGHPRSLHALVLTSDAYAPPDILAHADFAITEAVAFRNITTAQVANGNYASIGRTPGSNAPMKKVDELTFLLERGSIFYYSTENQKTELIKSLNTNTDAFKKIGYNQYLILERSK